MSPFGWDHFPRGFCTRCRLFHGDYAELRPYTKDEARARFMAATDTRTPVAPSVKARICAAVTDDELLEGIEA